MAVPAKKQLRALTIVAMTLLFSGATMMHLRIPDPSPEIHNALDWIGYGAVLSHESQVLLFRLQLALYFFGFVGFLTFARWGRFLILCSLVVSIGAIPFVGLHVSYGLSELCYTLGGVVFAVPFVLSHFPPCSNYFEAPEPDKSDA